MQRQEAHNLIMKAIDKIEAREKQISLKLLRKALN